MNGLISNYVTVALRGFHREPGYLGIAIASLSLALLIALLALSHIRFELSYDDWLSSKDRNYRLQSSQYPPGRPMRPLTSAPAAIVPALSNQIAGLEEIAMGFGSAIALSTNDFAFITPVHYATSNFLAFFEVEAIYGDAQQTLDDPLAIVLTSSQAKRIFGHNDVVGQVVSVDGHTDLRVGAIIPDWPENSHLSIDALTSINSPTFSDKELFLENWGSVGGSIYFRMSTPREPHELSRELNSVLADHAPLQYGVGYPDAGVPPFYTLSAIPLRRINLTENHGDNLFQNKARSLSSLAAVALLILAIAIFNVSNLFASRARNRLREHLVRRALGANNFQFTTQFIVEAVLVSVSAMIVAASIVSISVNLLASTGIRTHWSWNDPVIALSIALVTITVALSIGIPPAIPFARQYGKKRSTANPPWRRLDRVHPITITQFSVAVGLGCIAVVTGNNLWHLAKNDPGYDGSDVMIVWDTDVLPNRDAFVHAIRGLPSVKMVAEAGTVPTDFNRFSMSVGNRDSDDTQTFQLVNIDTHTFPLLNIETIAGRTFQSNRVADIVAHGADTNLQIIVTKSGAAALGYEHASDILGKQFRQLYAAKQEEQWRLASVIGVTNDIAFQSIQDPIEPTVFVQDPMAFSRVLIRVDPDQREQVVTSITEEWRKISPFHPLQIDWLDTRRDDGIRSEMQQAYLLISGATFAYILALIGLIALASKTLRAMSKEIALRKVLGATPWSIAIKTIRHFTLAMGIAVTIALPISMIINQNIEVSSTGGEASTVWLYFLVAAAAVVVSGAIVMTQALIAGSKPPMDSLGA